MPIKFPERKREPSKQLKVEESVWWELCRKHCAGTSVQPETMCREMHHLAPLHPIDEKEYKTILSKLKDSKRKGDHSATNHFLYLAAMAAYSNATAEKLKGFLEARTKLMEDNGFLGETFDTIRKHPDVSFKIASEYYSGQRKKHS